MSSLRHVMPCNYLQGLTGHCPLSTCTKTPNASISGPKRPEGGGLLRQSLAHFGYLARPGNLNVNQRGPRSDPFTFELPCTRSGHIQVTLHSGVTWGKILPSPAVHSGYLADRFAMISSPAPSHSGYPAHIPATLHDSHCDYPAYIPVTLRSHMSCPAQPTPGIFRMSLSPHIQVTLFTFELPWARVKVSEGKEGKRKRRKREKEGKNKRGGKKKGEKEK